MEVILNFMTLIINAMKEPMDIYGFQISFWDIFIFSIVAYLIFEFIGGIFGGDD